MKVLIYARVSTREQADSGISLASQVTRTYEYLEAVYGVDSFECDQIKDEGVSGSTLDRPALNCARKFCEEGEFDTLAVLRLDRLTRSVKDMCELVEWADRHDVRMISARDHIDTDSAAGRLLTNMMVSFAQFERELIGERTAEALHQLKEKDRVYGQVPYGKKRRGNDLLPHPDEQTVLSIIWKRHRIGDSPQEIADELNRCGYRKRNGSDWDRGTIYKITERLKKEEGEASAID